MWKGKLRTRGQTWCIVSSLLCLCSTGLAAVHYVNINGTNPIPPYTSWATAATRIQDAVNSAQAGDSVLVTNGIYAAGGQLANGQTSNRISVVRAIFVGSVNGSAATVIEGSAGVRGAYLVNGAVLSGFTLRNGASRNRENGG